MLSILSNNKILKRGIESLIPFVINLKNINLKGHANLKNKIGGN